MTRKQDYARSGNKKKAVKSNNKLLFIIAIIILLLFVIGLYFLKSNGSETSKEVAPQTVQEKAKPKSQLPSRPEETWSYIKELESRTVQTDANQKTLEKEMQLSEKQKEEFKRLEEQEKQKAKQLEEERKKAEALATQGVQTPTSEKTTENSTAVSSAVTPVQTDEQLKAQQKVLEQKKLAEQRKKEEERKKAELAKSAENAKKVEVVKAEPAKQGTAKLASESKVTTAGRFGLQCGAFKDRGAAENLQARLAMTGLNAFVASSNEWYRVRIGPVGDRAAAEKAKTQASSVAGCVLMTM